MLFLVQMAGPQAKICLYPFARLQFPNQNFVPCCADWFKPAYSLLAPENSGGEDGWNGPQAQELRRLMLSGNYRFCKRDMCQAPLFALDELDQAAEKSWETPLSEEIITAIQNGQVEMPEGPAMISLEADPRCNLKCASCRSDYIHHLNDLDKKQIEKCERLLERYGKDLQILKLAGDGEAFFSPWLRQVIQRCNSTDFPKLRFITLISNGLLLNQEQFEQLLPGSAYIRRLSISIDAGNEATYLEVREGGDWKRLMKNLQWISEQRASGRFDDFVINFAIRKANFRTIPEFVRLGERFGVDLINFTSLYNWQPRMAITDYSAEAVHIPTHPLHGEFTLTVKPYLSHPKIRMAVGTSFNVRGPGGGGF